MKPHHSLTIVIICLFFSCKPNKIETRKTLDKKTLSFITKLGLLDKDEKIIKYYSNFTEDRAGSFFTKKRVAHYWLDDRDKSKNDTSFAFYEDIIKMDTALTMPDTYAPFLQVTTKDHRTIRLYTGGTRDEVKKFCMEAIKVWKASQKH